MTDLNPVKVLYKIPIAVPAIEFRARVARIGGGDTALMDEIILRLLWTTTSLTIGTVRELFGLSTAQLDAFLSPLTAAGHVAVSEFGGLSLTEAGRKLFEGQNGIPRLREVRFHSEYVRIDQIALQPCAWNSSMRGFRPLSVEFDCFTDLLSLKERAQHILENEYDDLLLLRGRGFTDTQESQRQRPRISFVDDINDGYSLRHEMLATIAIQNQGCSTISFDGFVLESQVKAREELLERVTKLLHIEAESAEQVIARESLFRTLSLGLPNCPDLSVATALDRHIADGGLGVGENYYWCLGRPELIANTQIMTQIERVLKRLPLKRGEETRTVAWLVTIVSNSTFWGRGSIFEHHHTRLLRRLRDADPQCRSLLVMIGRDTPEQLERDDELAGAFDVTVCIRNNIADLSGIDAVLLPNEFAQITQTTFLGRSDPFPIPYCVASSREDWAIEATAQLIKHLLTQRDLVVKGSSMAEAREVLRSFIRMREPDPEPGSRPKLTLARKKSID